MHDWCYDTAGCPMFLEYFIPYLWKCYHHRPLCGKFSNPFRFCVINPHNSITSNIVYSLSSYNTFPTFGYSNRPWWLWWTGILCTTIMRMRSTVSAMSEKISVPIDKSTLYFLTLEASSKHIHVINIPRGFEKQTIIE